MPVNVASRKVRRSSMAARSRFDYQRGSAFGGVIALFLATGMLADVAREVAADTITLKNGMVFEGEFFGVTGLTVGIGQQTGGVQPIRVIDTGMQRYFVPRPHVVDQNADLDASRRVKFELKQRRTGRASIPDSIGSYADMTPFDEFGHRRVTLRIPGGAMDIVQGVTQLTPRHLMLEGLTHQWQYAIATTSVPTEQLLQLLNRAADRNDPVDRIKICQFLISAEMYDLALTQLNAVQHEFPDHADQVRDGIHELRQLRARRMLTELEHRRDAGQRLLAYRAARQFDLAELDAEQVRRFRSLIDEYESGRAKIESVLALLGEYQTQLDNPELVAVFEPLRSTIRERLNLDTISRMDSFLLLHNDDTLPVDAKLALACSGWMLGSANAGTDLAEALRLWDARHLLLDYFRTTDANRHEELRKELSGIEGVSADRIAKLIPQLPPIIESSGVMAGVAARIEVDLTDVPPPVAYSVLLPGEYNPGHVYPMIVALRSGQRTTTDQLVWWGGTETAPGQSQRRGYIVIAPEYVADDVHSYDSAARSHEIVLACIRDARRRFNVDSDRVFLTGHGMGGDAAFDIGMAHPDQFAGVIPIVGTVNDFCLSYWANCPELAWYIISGERDRDTIRHNASTINHMLVHYYDVIYSEYIGRGHEPYYEEIHKLFDWMDLHQRSRAPTEIDVTIRRPGDNHWYWVEALELPDSLLTPETLPRNLRRAPQDAKMKLVAEFSRNNTIDIRSGARRHVVRLTADMMDLEKQIIVRVRGRRKRLFADTGIDSLLDDFHRNADRQRLFPARLILE